MGIHGEPSQSEIEEFYRSNLAGFRVIGTQASSKCPFHKNGQERRPSFSIDISLGLWSCKAGSCGLEGNMLTFADKKGIPRGRIPGWRNGYDRKPKQAIEAIYDYKDEEGNLLFQAVRYSDKEFKQRRPDGAGGWTWKLGRVRRVLFRFPELLKSASKDNTVFIPEGEKDVETLRRFKLIATCNPQGAGKWREDYSKNLEGRSVVILPDNDVAGLNHAQSIARSLYGKAASIKVLKLPELPPKGDVSDWMKDGGTVERLLLLVQKEPGWSFEAGLPTIDLSEQDLASLTKRAWDAIRKANTPPRLFRRGGLILRTERDDDGEMVLRDVREKRMKHHLARAANWIKGKHGAKPLDAVVQDVLATPDIQLPILNRISSAPVFASDGEMTTRAGYCPKTRTIHSPPSGFVLPEVARAPSPDKVETARKLLMEDFLGDFPFVSEAERAHTVAFMRLSQS